MNTSLVIRKVWYVETRVHSRYITKGRKEIRNVERQIKRPYAIRQTDQSTNGQTEKQRKEEGEGFGTLLETSRKTLTGCPWFTFNLSYNLDGIVSECWQNTYNSSNFNFSIKSGTMTLRKLLRKDENRSHGSLQCYSEREKQKEIERRMEVKLNSAISHICFCFFFWRISVIATREIRVDCLMGTKTSSIFGGLVLLLKLSLLKKKRTKSMKTEQLVIKLSWNKAYESSGNREMQGDQGIDGSMLSRWFPFMGNSFPEVCLPNRNFFHSPNHIWNHEKHIFHVIHVCQADQEGEVNKESSNMVENGCFLSLFVRVSIYIDLAHGDLKVYLSWPCVSPSKSFLVFFSSPICFFWFELRSIREDGHEGKSAI